MKEILKQELISNSGTDYLVASLARRGTQLREIRGYLKHVHSENLNLSDVMDSLTDAILELDMIVEKLQEKDPWKKQR